MDGSTTTTDPPLLDLERDLPTTAEDVVSLRRVRRIPTRGPVRNERLLPPFVTPDAVRSRPAFSGAETPFELPTD